jgi:tetratricopeptide (TPR) repeat protein
MMRTVRTSVLMPAILTMLALSGCLQDQINATQQQVTQQQSELEQLEQQVAALQSQRGPYSTAPTPHGACDLTVMRVASKKGGERFAASDFGHALGYYQDAVTACSTSAQASLNVARTYEAMGDHSNALDYYRRAANATGPNAEPDAVRQAREALNRLGASG